LMHSNNRARDHCFTCVMRYICHHNQTSLLPVIKCSYVSFIIITGILNLVSDPDKLPHTPEERYLRQSVRVYYTNLKRHLRRDPSPCKQSIYVCARECVRACVYVCVRARERERERGRDHRPTFEDTTNLFCIGPSVLRRHGLSGATTFALVKTRDSTTCARTRAPSSLASPHLRRAPEPTIFT
jgi:hypothetical protein